MKERRIEPRWILVLLLALTKARSPRHHRRWRADLIVNIPAVKKGLSNQRMRIVQDLLTASLLGIHKVRLPQKLQSRRGCHYDANCYTQYVEALGFWNVFDKTQTTRALQRLGLTVVDDGASPISKFYTYSTFPIPASHLSLSDLSQLRANNASATEFYLFEPRYCCTIILPDNRRALSLATLINSALIANKKTARDADKVVAAFKVWADVTYTCALHWRLDDDFILSEHKLNPAAYMQVMNEALNGIAEECGHALLILGDVANHRLAPIRKHLNASYRLATKQSLFEHRNWSRDYHDYDDLVGAVDFDIGLRVNNFIGSPFSSFSVLVAAGRGDILTETAASSRLILHSELGGIRAIDHAASAAHMNNKNSLRYRYKTEPKRTLMPDIDVEDRLSALFRLQFPHSWASVSHDPCNDYIRLGPKYAKRLANSPTCPFDHKTQKSSWILAKRGFIKELNALKKFLFPSTSDAPNTSKLLFHEALALIFLLILLSITCCCLLLRYRLSFFPPHSIVTQNATSAASSAENNNTLATDTLRNPCNKKKYLGPSHSPSSEGLPYRKPPRAKQRRHGGSSNNLLLSASLSSAGGLSSYQT